MGEDPDRRATRAAGSSARSRTRCGGWAPTGSTSTRSTASIRGRTSTRRCRRSATSCTKARSARSGTSTFPASHIVEAQWVARERNLQRFVTEQPPYSILVRAAEADVAHVLAPWHGRHVLQPADRRLAVGRWRKDTGQQSSSRASRLPERFDLSTRQPTQARCGRGARAARRGDRHHVIQLAIAFMLNHPAITAALIGPRTMEQLESRSPHPTSSSTRQCWTGSTRSSRPARPSTRPTTPRQPGAEPAARRR